MFSSCFFITQFLKNEFPSQRQAASHTSVRKQQRSLFQFFHGANIYKLAATVVKATNMMRSAHSQVHIHHRKFSFKGHMPENTFMYDMNAAE
ncbi:MAG: hypothetical protein EAZ74_06625 [Alphaproteobacteria bacterium]|nr:MAG: hypothetical protein EAZ74_06625 [Alphaproteobacteria bacterium]